MDRSEDKRLLARDIPGSGILPEGIHLKMGTRQSLVVECSVRIDGCPRFARHLEKTDAQVAHIWSRLVFSGNAKSLPRVPDDKAMLEHVAKNPTSIGYVDSKSVSSSVKVLTIK